MTGITTDRRITAADIAREVGVSRTTVGFVLNATPGQTISPATTRKVLDAAERLGYRPHLAAQALARGRTNIVLLVLPDWPVDYSMRRHLDEARRLVGDPDAAVIEFELRGGHSLVPDGQPAHEQGHRRQGGDSTALSREPRGHRNPPRGPAASRGVEWDRTNVTAGRGQREKGPWGLACDTASCLRHSPPRCRGRGTRQGVGTATVSLWRPP